MANIFTLNKGKSHSLCYASHVSKAFKLIEVEEDVLDQICCSGVAIKGSPDSEAVLCTDGATYALKHVETTNSLLLVQAEQTSPRDTGPRHQQQDGTITHPQKIADAHQPIRITAIASSQIEMVRTAPRFAALDTMLSEQQYGDGEADECADDVTGDESRPGSAHDWYHLLDITQASAAELRKALKEYGALEDQGKWRLLEPAYQSTLLELVLLTAASESWPLTALPIDGICAALQADGYQPQVVRHIMSLYGHTAPGTPTTANIWALDERKVCLHAADKIFEQQARWPLASFLQAWRDAAPEGMTPQQDMLAGEALIEESGGEQIVRRLAAKELPKDPSLRFAKLFAIRPRWSMQNLQPYLEGLQAPGQSAEALLLKYCRVSQSNPQVPAEYSARY